MNTIILITCLISLSLSSPLAIEATTLVFGGMVYKLFSPVISRLQAEAQVPIARKAGQFLGQTWLKHPEQAKAFINHIIPATANLQATSAFQASYPIIMILDGVAKQADKSPRKAQEFVYVCKVLLEAFKEKVETGRVTLAPATLLPTQPHHTNLGWKRIPYMIIEALYLEVSWPYAEGIKIDALAQGLTHELLQDPTKSKQLIEAFIEAFYKEYPTAIDSIDGIFHLVPGGAWSRFLNHRTSPDPTPSTISERLRQTLGYMDEIIINLGKSADEMDARNRKFVHENAELTRWANSESSWVKPNDLKPAEGVEEDLVATAGLNTIEGVHHHEIEAIAKGPRQAGSWTMPIGGKIGYLRQRP